MKEPKKIALVGLGGISQSVHLPIATRLHDQVEVVAVVDLSPARVDQIRSAYGDQLKGFRTVDDLLSEVAEGLVVDGVVLATTGTHAADSAKLLEAAIPVLSEKPLGYSLAEHDVLLERFGDEALAAPLRVGYMKEYDTASREARRLLEGKQIRAVEVEVLHPADGAQLSFANLRPTPTDVDPDLLAQVVQPTDSAMGDALGHLMDVQAPPDEQPGLERYYPGIIMGSVIHDIALLRYLVGGIGTVDMAKRYGPAFPGSLTFGGSLRDHDAPWLLNWHFIADYPEYRETVTVHHEQGSVQLVFDVPYLLNVATKLNIVEGLPGYGVARSTQTWPQSEAFETEWREFIALLDDSAHDSAQAPGHATERSGSSIKESRRDIEIGQEMARALAKSTGVALDSASEVGRG